MAASLMGSHYGIGVDVDQDALEIARRNFDKFDIDNVDLLYSDVQTLSINPGWFNMIHIFWVLINTVLLVLAL